MKIYVTLAILVLLAVTFQITSQTPLDDYVNTPDSHYTYKLIKTYSQTGYTLFILNMTSQKWQDETIVDRPIWWHYLCVTVPDKITRPDASLIWIGGGGNSPNIPKPSDNEVAFISSYAVGTGTIGTHLQQIPNQPLVFKKDPSQERRSEDAIIAWTWKTFIENPSDPTILLRLPMTKAVVRAMDTVQDFAKKNDFADIKKFMLAGESKRGWTTWTTAAVDPKRVFSAVPIVMDFLNLNTNLHNHYKSLGGWTFAFDDYYKANITRYIDSRGIFELEKIVDPLSYLDRYQNTNIMVVTTSGDEFFMNDDTHFYWDQLVAATNGKVLLKRIPNAEHEIYAHEINELFTLTGFFLSTYENKLIPNLKWSRPNNSTHGIIRATIDFKTSPKPFNVRVYYAKTLDNKRRDFRLVVGDPNNPDGAVLHPVIWFDSEKIVKKIETDTVGAYEVAFQRPLSGWFAFFLQFSFKGVEYSANTITTETNIIPETYPFDDCSGDTCYGKLV